MGVQAIIVNAPRRPRMEKAWSRFSFGSSSLFLAACRWVGGEKKWCMGGCGYSTPTRVTYGNGIIEMFALSAEACLHFRARMRTENFNSTPRLDVHFFHFSSERFSYPWIDWI